MNQSHRLLAGLLLGTVLLVSCSTPSEGPDTSGAAIPTSSSPHGPSTTWDATPPQTIDLSDAPPITATVDNPSPFGSHDHALLAQRCMAEAGWLLKVDHKGDKGTEMTGPIVPDEQRDLYDNAFDECFFERPIREGLVLPIPTEFDRAGHELLFRYWMEVTVPCIQVHGFSMTEPQSMEVWLEMQELPGVGVPWHPFDAYVNYWDNDELWDACPAGPSDAEKWEQSQG